MTQVMVLFGKDLNDLAEKMNEFFEGRNIISSPIYQELYEDAEGKMYQYYSVVYVKDSPNEIKEFPNSKPASDKQMNLLWKMGYPRKERLTMDEAKKLIEEKLNGK